jgi:hypothetical protein
VRPPFDCLLAAALGTGFDRLRENGGGGDAKS